MIYKVRFKVAIGYILCTASGLFADICVDQLQVQQRCFKLNAASNAKNITFCKDKDVIFGKTFFSFRPQDSNAATKILGLLDQNKRFNFSLSYQQSFNNMLSKWFSFNGSNCMTVGIPGANDSYDIVGSQIGLSLGNTGGSLTTGEIGQVCVDPKVKNLIFNLDWSFDQVACCDYLWARVSAAIVRTETDLNICPKGSGSVKDKYAKGLFSTTCQETDVPYVSITDALEGDKAIGDVPPLSYAKFSKPSQTKTDLAGIHLTLGYEFFNRDDSYLGLGVNLVVPTGNRPTGTYLFEPIVGANHSLQLGGLLEYCKTWGSADSGGGFYFYGTANHIYRTSQCRTFALKNNGAGSQILLVKNFTETESLKGLDRVANLLNGYADIGADVMVDAAVMLQWIKCNFFMNVGYNFWGRSREKVKGSICFSGFEDKKFGIKGDQLASSEVMMMGSPTCKKDTTTASESKINKIAAADSSRTLLTLSDIDVGSALHPKAISNKIFCSMGYKFWGDREDNAYKKAYVSLSGEFEFGNNAAIDQWGVIGKFGIDF